MKNIILVGFMGTGKSSVGKELAKQLGMNFISTDDLIEERARCEISDIFRKYGEPFFRKMEKEIIKEVSALGNVVIAAGGGAVLDPQNILNMRKNGTIFCLTAAPEAIYERTKNYKHRPLLNVENPMEAIKRLLETRALFYNEAQHNVDTSNKSVGQVAQEIRKILNI